MTKSSSIYMGEGKMALSGKWGIAMVASIVAMTISMLPSIIQNVYAYFLKLDAIASNNYSNVSATNGFLSIISIAWAICVTVPISYACIVGLRQMHIANEQPMDVMFEKFKQNWKKYICLGTKVALKILVVIAIPLGLYLFSFFATLFGGAGTTLELMDFSFLCMIAIIVGCLYKYFEYIFAPFVCNDNPEMTDKEVLNKCSELTDGKKWLMFKIYLRAILPAILYGIALIFVLGVILLIFVGGMIFSNAFNPSDLDSFNSLSNVTPSSVLLFFSLYLISIVGLSAYVHLRTILPMSVLYSELTGSNDKVTKESEPIILLPEDGANTATEETAKEEEKKAEPDIPYEQRYMPKSENTFASDASSNGENKKDDSDIPYEQRYMPR